MSCERIREQIPEALAGRLDKAAREALVDHLEGCAACRTQVAELNTVWRGLENLDASMDASMEPTPDAIAKARFQEMLAAYQAGMQAAQPAPSARVIAFPSQPAWRIAIAAGLVLGGILCGRYLGQPAAAAPSEMAQLRTQVESLRQTVALSMLQQQSPLARMRGVSYSEQIPQPDRQLLEALLDAVQHDSNVNVRLSAVDALQKFSADPGVIRSMADALVAQDSPLVQIALIDLLVQLDARGAAPEIARLAKSADADEMVRQRATWAQHKLEGSR